MIETSDNKSFKTIAEKHNITTKTLIKLFKKHLGKTPANFRKNVRFRQAINKYKSKEKTEKLTDITFATTYFDQSHMIRDFKAMTGKTPKVFFNELKISADGNINIIFSNEG